MSEKEWTDLEYLHESVKQLRKERKRLIEQKNKTIKDFNQKIEILNFDLKHIIGITKKLKIHEGKK